MSLNFPDCGGRCDLITDFPQSNNQNDSDNRMATPTEPNKSIEWYAGGQGQIVNVGGIQITVRFVERKGRRGRIAITAPRVRHSALSIINEMHGSAITDPIEWIIEMPSRAVGTQWLPSNTRKRYHYTVELTILYQYHRIWVRGSPRSGSKPSAVPSFCATIPSRSLQEVTI